MRTVKTDAYTASIDVRVIFHSPEQEGKFIHALTGKDNDILLAMENALNEALDIDGCDPDVDRIWLDIEPD